MGPKLNSEGKTPRVLNLRRGSLGARCLMLFVATLFAFTLAAAQTGTATLSGTVSDPNGALVPGANITLTEVATGVQRTATTNEHGSFTIPFIKPSTYVLRIEYAGFLTAEVNNVVLNVSDERALKIQMKVGDVKETVNITSETPLINESSSVSTVVDQSYVQNMPLNGRSFQDLILLTPGVVTQTPQNTGTHGGTGEFSVNGQRTESNYYTVDGVSANIGTASGEFSGTWNTASAGASGSVPGSTALGTTQALVSVDALQEFRVQSSTYSAEFGRNPGGQFGFETKSGNNQWHGSAYDYLRNGRFDAQDWFNNYLGTPNHGLKQNDFGGTLGGPIRKDKTFFFFSYEGLRLHAPHPATTNLFVPDTAMRLSAPAALKPIMNAFPLPTPGGIDDAGSSTAQFIGTWSDPNSINTTGVRIDQNVGNKLRFFFRFNNATSSAASRLSTNASTQVVLNSAVRTYTGGATMLISSRIVNDFRLNYSSNQSRTSTSLVAIGGSIPFDLLSASQLGAGADAFVCILNPSFSCIALDQGNWSSAQHQLNFVDTLSVAFGKHQFKFGADFRRLTPNNVRSSPSVTYFFFRPDAVATNSPFLFTNTSTSAYPLYKNFSAFADDNWRLTRRLTLDLGVRWDINPPPGVTKGLKPFTLQGSSIDTLVIQPQGTPLWKTTWNNFAPRFGIAYLFRDKQSWQTVVRGGAGIFFDTGQQTGSLAFNGPGLFANDFRPGSYPINGSTFVFPAITDPCAKSGCPGPYSTTPYGYDPHLKLPYTIHWNASVEQGIGASQALTLSYVGAHGSRLLRTDFVNPAHNPNTDFLVLIENGLSSDYEAMQIQFQRRLSHGLTGLASYTWSHCLDYGSSNSDQGWVRGNCDFDVRHSFTGAASWDLPKIRREGMAAAVLNHWGLDGRLTMRSAFPITLFGNSFIGPDGRSFNAGLSFVSGQPVYLFGSNCDTVLQSSLLPGHGCPGGKAINPNAFQNVSAGLGNAPRNFARLFGAWNFDMALRREFTLREKIKLQFRAEAFNLFNHPNFGTVDQFFGDSTFGQATATLASSQNIGSALYQLGGPRSMQFAVKVIF